MTLVILGAGPAGLAAAEAASSRGMLVTLVDDNPAPGGQIWRGGPGKWRDARAAALWDALRQRANVRLLSGSRVVANAGPRVLLLETPKGPHQLYWTGAIICSGARELLLPFPGWTLPGVTGAGAIQALAKEGMPLKGKRVVIAGSGPLLLAAAETVRRHGGTVAAIAEQRGMASLLPFFGELALHHPAKALQALRLMASLRGARYLHDAAVISANGDERLRSVTLRQGDSTRTVDCDFLACGFGLVPSLEGASLFGCATDQGKIVVDASQATSAALVWAAGESTGIGGVDKALAEGRIAGLAAAGYDPDARDVHARVKSYAFADLLNRTFTLDPALRELCTPSTIVCRCEDVRSAQLAAFRDWRMAKLQTRVGMGPCQGRVCGSACQFLFGWDSGGARSPVFPASAASLASVCRRAEDAPATQA
jgi:NADPH-dependent 2,4-dienoyl-CoA reductase/sulfur reductase-like enzyme